VACPWRTPPASGVSETGGDDAELRDGSTFTEGNREVTAEVGADPEAFSFVSTTLGVDEETAETVAWVEVACPSLALGKLVAHSLTAVVEFFTKVVVTTYVVMA
jgi:hypothetical protein